MPGLLIARVGILVDELRTQLKKERDHARRDMRQRLNKLHSEKLPEWNEPTIPWITQAQDGESTLVVITEDRLMSEGSFAECHRPRRILCFFGYVFCCWEAARFFANLHGDWVCEELATAGKLLWD